jgi:hypothetical protein
MCGNKPSDPAKELGACVCIVLRFLLLRGCQFREFLLGPNERTYRTRAPLGFRRLAVAHRGVGLV